MDSSTSAFLTVALVSLMGAAWFLTLIPPCDDAGCVASHEKHRVAAVAARLEREHATFHGESQPNPLCALCAARKRDKDAG